MNYRKYYLYKEQVSYDGGATWSDTGNESPSGNPVGEYETYEQCTGGTPPAPTCECSIFSASTSVTVPNSGGTVTLGTFSDDCLGGFSYSFTTPTGMITSAAVSAGTNVSAYTVTISSNQETTAKTGTITVSYTAGENSCTTSAISISQAAAPAPVTPKATLRLLNGTTVTVPCNGDSELTRNEITSLVTASDVVSVNVGDCVTKIGETAFWGCDKLTSVNFPNTLTHLYDSCFRECNGLTSVTIPDSVQVIGFDAFHLCDGLKEVTIGTGWTGTTRIGRSFQDCRSLMKVTVKATRPANINDTFYFCDDRVMGRCWQDGFKIYVPRNSVDAYRSATNWSYYEDVIEPIS